eukprot:1000950-Alexandrium_andersonii.AAC.1
MVAESGRKLIENWPKTAWRCSEQFRVASRPLEVAARVPRRALSSGEADALNAVWAKPLTSR